MLCAKLNVWSWLGTKLSYLYAAVKRVVVTAYSTSSPTRKALVYVGAYICIFVCFVCLFVLCQSNILRSYQDRYRLVTVHTHGDFIVLPHGKTLATITMTWYPTQSNYLDVEPTSPCPFLIIQSAWLGSDSYQFIKLLVWLDQGSNLWG